MAGNLAAHWWIILLIAAVVAVVIITVIVVAVRASRSRAPICPDPSAHFAPRVDDPRRD